MYTTTKLIKFIAKDLRWLSSVKRRMVLNGFLCLSSRCSAGSKRFLWAYNRDKNVFLAFRFSQLTHIIMWIDQWPRFLWHNTTSPVPGLKKTLLVVLSESTSPEANVFPFSNCRSYVGAESCHQASTGIFSPFVRSANRGTVLFCEMLTTIPPVLPLPILQCEIYAMTMLRAIRFRVQAVVGYCLVAASRTVRIGINHYS